MRAPRRTPLLGRFRAMTRIRIASVFFLLFSWTPPALADLKGVSVDPPAPAGCDSVSIIAAGDLDNGCDEIVSATIQGPLRVVCIQGPCPAQFHVEILIRRPNSLAERICP